MKDLKIFDADIWVLITDLNYNPIADQIRQVKRNRYDKFKKERKGRFLVQRITIDAACVIEDKIERENIKKEYDKAIMNKYNVPANYRENRWFMEQVRPTL